jgi:hypothetical protein
MRELLAAAATIQSVILVVARVCARTTALEANNQIHGSTIKSASP